MNCPYWRLMSVFHDTSTIVQEIILVIICVDNEVGLIQTLHVCFALPCMKYYDLMIVFISFGPHVHLCFIRTLHLCLASTCTSYYDLTSFFSLYLTGEMDFEFLIPETYGCGPTFHNETTWSMLKRSWSVLTADSLMTSQLMRWVPGQGSRNAIICPTNPTTSV